MEDLNLEIQKYVRLRQTDPKYQGGLMGLQVVQKVFHDYPNSTDLAQVLLKVAVLNDLYHTHLSAPFKMAKHIVALADLDAEIGQGRPEAVSKIADISFKNTLTEDVYIFATKYCFMSNPKKYFIYDPIVKKELTSYLNLSESESENLNHYAFFSDKMNQFIQIHHITANHTDLDTFLWLSGHEKLSRM